MTKPTCEYTVSDNHSTDRIAVWHGSATPLVLCGYHEQNYLKEALKLKHESEKTNA
jgi:Zn ribbon nucleic-acid-binding protein